MKGYAVRKPPFLKPGDTVALLAPAGVITRPSVIDDAVALLENEGFRVKVFPQSYQRYGSFAGKDDTRLQALQQALDDPSIRLIWALRGGYGSIRLKDRIDWSGFSKHPKWFAGFSDISVWLQEIYRLGFASLHTFMPVNLAEEIPSAYIRAFFDLLKGKTVRHTVKRDSMNKNEQPVEGELTGGNLATLYSLLPGSNLSFRNQILFLEDVGENLHAVDRMFQSLRAGGFLAGLKALLIGTFSEIKQSDPVFPYSVKQIVSDAVKSYDYPVFFNFPVGHTAENFPVIHGGYYRIEIDKEKWAFSNLEEAGE